MNRKAYELANEIKTDLSGDFGWQGECLGDVELEKYKNSVLGAIKEEKERSGKMEAKAGKVTKGMHGVSRWATAAACAAVVFLGAMAFGKEAHALIERISWNIGSALGLSGDLAEYRDVIGTSAADKGYVVTLQEAAAAEEKLVVNYTIQREDGEPMEEILTPFGSLYINGEEVLGGSSGSGGFLNEEQTAVGIVMDYDVFGVDMSRENTYQIKFDEIYDGKKVKGKWDFQFVADGADLIADTKRVSIQKEFEIGEGVTVTLEELTINELEQRISYRAEGAGSYMFMLMAEDDAGHTAQFDTKTFREGRGYMQNEEILYDGRIDGVAGTVKMTLYAVKMPEESGRLRDDYEQVGEVFEVVLN